MGSNFVLENNQPEPEWDEDKIFDITCLSNKKEKLKIKILFEIATGSVCSVYLVELLHPQREKKFFAMKASEIREKSKIQNYEILRKEFEIHSKFSSYQDYFTKESREFEIAKTMFEEKQLNFVVPYGSYFVVNDLEEILFDEEPEGTKYFCFLMEPCEMSLRALLRLMKERMVIIPLDFKLLNLLEIFESMDFMNRKNIIHRDIRPDNLLVYKHQFMYKDSFISDHPLYCSKIVDFGKSSTGICEGGRGSGKTSPWYTAPENLEEGVLYDTKSDVWGIGVLSLMFIMDTDSEDHQKEAKESLQQKVESFKNETSYPSYIDELLDFILNHMVCERKNRLDIVECWKFVRRFFLRHLIKETFRDPTSCEEVLFRIAKKVHLFTYKESNIDISTVNSILGQSPFSFDTRKSILEGIFPFNRREACERVTLFDTLLFKKRKSHTLQNDHRFKIPESLILISCEIWGDIKCLYSRIRTEDSTKNTDRGKIENQTELLCFNDFDSVVGKYCFVRKFRKEFCRRFCYYCLKKRSKKKRLLVCTGCSLIHYCSRVCQEKDWVLGPSKWRPHKHLCQAIREKNIRFGSEMSYPQMQDTFEYYEKKPHLLKFDNMVSFKLKEHILDEEKPSSTILNIKTKTDWIWKEMKKIEKFEEILLKCICSLHLMVLQFSENECNEIVKLYLSPKIQEPIRSGVSLSADVFEKLMIEEYKKLYDEEKNPIYKGYYATSVAKFLYQNFNYQESMKFCKLSWGLNTRIHNQLEVNKLMGCNAWRLGKGFLAVKNLEKALSLNEDYPDAHFFLGYVYKDLHYLEKAIHHFSKCFHISFKKFRNLVSNKNDNVDYVKSSSVSVELLKHRTMCSMSLKYIGFCVEMENKFEEAKQYLRWTLELNPFDPTARGDIKTFERNEKLIKKFPKLYDILDSSDYMAKVESSRGIF